MADAVPRYPNLNLTAEEKRVFYQLFQAADKTNLGVITGEFAVPFFEKTKLSPETLGLIWQIADRENRGLLTPSGFSIVLRLIGHAQAGHAPSEELALQPGPLPKFESRAVDTSSAPSTLRAPEAEAASPPSPPAGPIRVPPLNPEDVNKFMSLFEKSGSRDGLLSGETAKQIFERARLPNEILGRIWNLSDTKERGALDLTEFVIAMHLLTSYKSGAMRGIPQTLPPGLYDAASRRGPSRSSVGSRSGLDVPPVPAIPKQFTGSMQQRTQSPASRQPFASPLSAQSTGGDWLITPPEKAHFDGIFATIDTAKSGFISGDQAVTFFMNAKLPEETLAQIWDLADVDADGQLSREEFAVAMYLVLQQRTGKDPLPQTLPPALIPPNMRRSSFPKPTSAPVASAAPAPAPAPTPRSAAEDLFGLDTFGEVAPSSPPAQVAQTTGGSNGQYHTPSSPAARASPQTPSTTFKPFVPSSSFGQSLQPQLTGASPHRPLSVASPNRPSSIRSPPPPSDDLLGDNDPEESKKLTQETADLANLSNQIGSLAKEMQTVQQKRTSAEQDLSQTSQQKRDFEARLAQARAMYEREVKNFKALEEKLNTSRTETAKLQHEYALIEGSRQDLQNQYNQVAAALEADQQENSSLKEKIRQANAQVDKLKPALEKARSDARQQRGLVAINKKQLATVESEREKLQSEIEEVSRKTQEHPEDSGAAAVTSLASTTSQNTNPFFRRTATASSDGALSPDVSHDQQRAFDSLFGTTLASPSSSTPPPPTSFRSESPSVSQHAVFKSPATSGVPTPSVSPPPSQSNESRQLTPSILPLREPHSLGSSTMVSPPASRFGVQENSEPGSPSLGNASEAKPPNPSENSTTLSPFDESEVAKARFPEMPIISSEPVATNSTAVGDANQEGGKDPSFDELFGVMARERSQSQKVNDFEEAFAAMRSNAPEAKKNTETAAAEGEFPPIQEFDDNDDASSASEAPMTFDDNFNPTLSSAAKDETTTGSINEAQLSSFSAPGAFPSPGSTMTNQPPVLQAQESAPKYEDSVSRENQANFPPEYNGLLPGRTDPTAAPDAPHSVESSTGAFVVHGEPQVKGPAPDFDAAFAGLDLAPAKDVDEEDEEDDEVDSHYNKNTTDFDFSFDSPSSHFKSDSHHDNASSHGPSPDFFNFDQNFGSSAFSATAAPADASSDSKKPESAAPAASNDWDALFAPLEKNKTGQDFTEAKGTNGSSSKQTEKASEGTAAGAQGEKAPGWALAADAGEDDQILQKLTGMGFPRHESLVALEKFDYNLEKAADYLTSKSL